MSKPDVIAINDYRRPTHSPWQESLHRLARAQAIAWHRLPIKERLALLKRVDQEQEKQK
jgi:hypothetical protein